VHLSPSVPDQDRQERPRLRAVELHRLSTTDQLSGSGLERQRAQTAAIISANGYESVEVVEIVDVGGASVLAAPEIQRLLEKVENREVDAVCVSEISRLVRPDSLESLGILDVFRRSGCLIAVPGSTIPMNSAEGFLHGGLQALLAGFDKMQLLRRMMASKEARRRAGKHPGSYINLPTGVGYDRVREKFFYNERIGAVVEAFRLVDEEGIRNLSEVARRTSIRAATLRKLLRNKLFIGIREYLMRRDPSVKRTRADGRQGDRPKIVRDDPIRVQVISEPAVTEERFNRVQRVLDSVTFNHHETRKRHDTCNLATGLTRCGYCAETFYSSSGRRATGQRSGQYFCKRNYYLYRDQLGGCSQPNLRQPELDSLIRAFAVKVLTNADTLTAIINDSIRRAHETISPFPVDATAEVDALRRADKRLLQAFEAGAIEVDLLRDRRNAIKAQIEAIARRDTNTSARGELIIDELAKKVVRGAFRLKRLNHDPHAQKAIILATFSEIYVKDRSVIAFKFREDFGVGNQMKVGAGFSTPPIHLPAPFTLEPADPLPHGMRRCSCCRKIFPAAEFYPRKGQCRTCIAGKAHEAYERRWAASRKR
jgi:DNA invertase Pin-like site-specific DNA recombinase